MFGIGPTELIVIVAVALMLFSPRELPKLIRSIAKVWASIRATADEFREAIMTADGVDELQSLVKGTKEEVRRAEANARRELMKARADMRRAQQKLVQTAQATKQIRQREEGLEGESEPVEGQPQPSEDPARAARMEANAEPVAPETPAPDTATPEPTPPPPPTSRKVEEGAA